MSCLLNMGSTDGSASTRVMRIFPASSGYQDLRSSYRRKLFNKSHTMIRANVPPRNHAVLHCANRDILPCERKVWLTYLNSTPVGPPPTTTCRKGQRKSPVRVGYMEALTM